MRRPVPVPIVLAATLAALVLAPRVRVEAGACARPSPQIEVWTPEGVVIPAGEAIVVGLGRGSARTLGPVGGRSVDPLGELGGGSGSGGPTDFEGAVLEREGEPSIALGVVALAPSVARLVPARAPAPGAWTLVRGAARVAVSFGEGGGPPALRAPRVTSASIRSRSGGGPRRSTTTSFGIELASRAPDGVLGIVASQGERATLGVVLPSRGPVVSLVSLGGRCQMVVPGLLLPSSGASVRFAFFDALGRVSPPSAPVTVQ